jgi:hypothetical protein
LGDQLIGLLSLLGVFPAFARTAALLGGSEGVLGAIEEHLRNLESACNVAIVRNRGEKTIALLGILPDLVKHLVVEEEVNDLQLTDFGDHQIELTCDSPELLEPALVVVHSQLLEDLAILILLLVQSLPFPQPFPEGSCIALLQTALALPDLSILIEQIYLLFDGCDLTSEQGGDGRFRLADVDGSEELEAFIEHAGGGSEEVAFLEAGGAAEEGVALEAT